MKNPNCSKKEVKQIAASFSFENWSWLSTQMSFLDATETKTAQEIRDVADVLLTEKLNQSL